jgi:hypothetical protein
MKMDRTQVKRGVRGGRPSPAFTLLEVIIACAVFFMVAFAVLGVVAQSLAAARKLEQRDPDPALAATLPAVTNILVEGVESGDFEQEYPGLFPGWHWTREITEVWSNRLFQVDIAVTRSGREGTVARTLSIQLFKPQSPPGSASSAF